MTVTSDLERGSRGAVVELLIFHCQLVIIIPTAIASVGKQDNETPNFEAAGNVLISVARDDQVILRIDQDRCPESSLARSTGTERRETQDIQLRPRLLCSIYTHWSTIHNTVLYFLCRNLFSLLARQVYYGRHTTRDILELETNTDVDCPLTNRRK
jgi:hypothetical protein